MSCKPCNDPLKTSSHTVSHPALFTVYKLFAKKSIGKTHTYTNVLYTLLLEECMRQKTHTQNNMRVVQIISGKRLTDWNGHGN